MISYRELRILLYAAQAVLGLFLVALACHLFTACDTIQQPISQLVSGVVLFAVGLGCALFGLEAFLLRDDPDLWR